MTTLAALLDRLFLGMARRYPYILPWLRAVLDRAIDKAQGEIEREIVSHLDEEAGP